MGRSGGDPPLIFLCGAENIRFIEALCDIVSQCASCRVAVQDIRGRSVQRAMLYCFRKRKVHARLLLALVACVQMCMRV